MEPFTATGSYMIPAQSGHGVLVKEGARFRIVDVEGTQVSDLWAICTDEPQEWLSTGHTFASVRRMFPPPDFHDMLYRPATRSCSSTRD